MRSIESNSESFTRTDAEYLASKVATDLKRIQRLYGEPSDKSIREYEQELVSLLMIGVMKKIIYGFKRNHQWIEPTLIYVAFDIPSFKAVDDDPGRIRAGADISGAWFTSSLFYSDTWDELSDEEKKSFKSSLPFQRKSVVESESGINGYVDNDHTYSSGGKSLIRSSVKKIK